MLPPGLMLVLCLLIGGFFVSMTGILRRKKYLEKKYESVGNTGSLGSSSTQGNTAAVMSYQNPASVDYSIPSQQKDVTYCVIDGRLVDQ